MNPKMYRDFKTRYRSYKLNLLQNNLMVAERSVCF